MVLYIDYHSILCYTYCLIPPSPPIYRSLQKFVRKLGRVHMFLMGFHWVEVRGRRVPPSEAHILVLAPHTSYADALSVFACQGLVSGVSREENGKTPIVGSRWSVVHHLEPAFNPNIVQAEIA